MFFVVVVVDVVVVVVQSVLLFVGHTSLETPDPIRTQKLRSERLHEYCGK